MRSESVPTAFYANPERGIVVEMGNVRERRDVRTIAWGAAAVLADLFHFDGELVRCNTGAERPAPGFDHSYLLVFTSDEIPHTRPK
jgi:hypothetical protein